jgi:hypothetical protein
MIGSVLMANRGGIAVRRLGPAPVTASYLNAAAVLAASADAETGTRAPGRPSSSTPRPTASSGSWIG